MLQKVENTGGEKVICLDCSKIVKKNVKKSCRGRMLSTQLTGNSVDVPGQPNHEISSENSLQTGWQSSCFCVRILHVFCDFFDFKNICQTWKKKGHLWPIFQRTRQLNRTISEKVSKAKLSLNFMKSWFQQPSTSLKYRKSRLLDA